MHYRILKNSEVVNNITADELFVIKYCEKNGYTYEEIPESEPTEDKQSKISELKRNLADTDYIACKIAEGAATREEYADMIAQRQAWRDEINELQKELINNGT